MKYSAPIKFIAFLLSAAALLAAVGSTIGIVHLVEENLYTDTFDDWLYQSMELRTYDLASSLAERHAVTKLSNCTPEVLQELGYRYLFEDVLSWSGFSESSFSYTISTAKDGVVDSVTNEAMIESQSFEFVCSVDYPIMITDEAVADELYGRNYRSGETLTLDDSQAPVSIRYYDSPKYTVVVTLLRDAAMNRDGTSVPLVELLYSLRYHLILVLTVAILVFPAGLVYLCTAAGRSSRGNATHPGALNYLPLDIYAAGGAVLCALLLNTASDFLYKWTKTGRDFNAGTLALTVLMMLCAAVICIGFIYATATQLKQPDNYFLRHTLLYRLGKWLHGALSAFIKQIPQIWKLLLLCILAICAITTCAVIAVRGTIWPLILAIIGTVGIVCYCGFAFGMLLRGARRMSQGNLNAKIDTRHLLGSYSQCADHLNTLADVAIVAARKQMQSDRMKTELITNVSHDIKTPLTSIINYVDILSQAQTEAERQQYLEVLGRQSQRLKRLIEDLVELSKASTGNIHADIIPLNATETVTQALGEFSDKLSAARLQVVFDPPQAPLLMLADGRMSWRVLSNLLSNVVKYAMPETRVYLSVFQEPDWVLIAMKNVSREPLNVPVEELTDRFVRGDTARNTEGSGLGLNIAQSLMELQHGQMELQIDGDLFKVTLRFPCAE